MKMEAICPSETSVDFHPTKRRYIPETELFKLGILILLVRTGLLKFLLKYLNL
jgi:hypothetical protein